MAYVSPYEEGAYLSPYAVKGEPLLFANLHNLFCACSDGERLDVSIILPGNIHSDGSSVDALRLPVLATKLQRIWEERIKAPGKTQAELNLDVHVSWECDDRSLSQFRRRPKVDEKWHLNDLEKYFPNLTCREHRARETMYRGEKARHGVENKASRHFDTEEEWVEACLKEMEARQQALLEKAKGILGNRNLLVVGSPKVNQVQANLCHIQLVNHKVLGELGMYIVPSAGTLPTKLVRHNKDQARWQEWRDEYWPHNNIGWLHLMRNPWANPDSSPRFLICLGGFHDAGTQAAMWKLTDIFELFFNASQAAQDPAHQFAHMLEQDSDFLCRNAPASSSHSGLPSRHEGLQRAIPGHVVNAWVDIPLNWFWHVKRTDKGWTSTPTSMRGEIVDYEDVREDIPPRGGNERGGDIV